ncbi:rho GTPase-activating protein 1 [Coffea arabica]|uniref:Rho GTPase-activating protein 1 n=1 Tax=Coffea arabica TaxID=13443 RepID=A0A6P6U0A0_COFAR|nr:rho GTPase-activating protein 5-like [Coffea arabica]
MTEVLHSSSSSSSPSISTPTDNGTLFQSFLRRREEEEEEIIARITGSEGESEEEGGEVKEKENKERRDHQLSLLAFLVTLIRKSFWMACKTTTGGGGREELGNRGGGAAGGMEIGWPTNVRHVAHVTFDRFNGFLGLPVEFEPEVPRRAPSASATVFGVSTESMQLSFDSRGNSIPTILLLMQGRLYAQGGLQAEGIFRINAENSQEEYVRDQLNGGTVPEGIDVHCLAGLIKAWFRELPSGVLDPISPEQIMQCQTMEDCAALVRLLPSSEAALLDWAINLMADVVQLEHLNKMNSRNIAMVFAPNMTQMADPLTALMYAVQVMNFLKTLIEKTLRDREDSVVEQASMFHREPYDENGHQSPEVCVEDATESNEEPEPLFVAGEPEPDSASECQQVDNISVEEYVSSSTSPEECSDESVSSGTPIGPYTATNLASGPRNDIKESIPESRTGQSSDSIQMNCTKRTEEQHMVALAIGVQNKSKGISNLSRINSLTERIEAWR